MKSNQLDNFESLIKSSLDKQRAAYDSNDWDKLNEKLNQANNPSYAKLWIIGTAIAAILGVVYLVPAPNTATEQNTLSTPKQENEVTDLIINNESSATVQLTEEEHNEIKEVFNNAKKEIGRLEETYALDEKKNVDNETLGINNKEAKHQNIEDTPITEENRLRTIDDGASTNETIIANEVVSIQKASFHMNTFECCEGTIVDFISERQPNVDYLWSFDDGNYSKTENPSHLFASPGNYKVSLMVRSKIDNSIMTKSNDQLLIVHPKPQVNFEWEMNEENGVPYTSLINLTDKGTSWKWNFGDGSNSIEKDPNHTYRKKGQYLLTLTASNLEGCTSAVNQDILIDADYNLLAPNSFTPNGDGINDYFLPAGLNRLNGSFTMTIYSQIEGLIYDTKNIDRPWDGTNQKAGTTCPEGSYVWVVKLTNEKGETEQYKGAILLLK